MLSYFNVFKHTKHDLTSLQEKQKNTPFKQGFFVMLVNS